jgi:hypothetical protein
MTKIGSHLLPCLSRIFSTLILILLRNRGPDQRLGSEGIARTILDLDVLSMRNLESRIESQ